MLFDPEKYIQKINSRQQNALAAKSLKAPHYKVPANNLPKLAFDKKIVNIVIDIKIKDPQSSDGSFFMLRDRFDWDISEVYMRPIDFARQLVESLGIYPSKAEKEKIISQIETSILS